MKLGKSEKTAISLLIVFAILGSGGYFLVYPKINHIKDTNVKIAEQEELIKIAKEAIETEKAVTRQFIETAIKVKRAEKNFCRELTQTEAVDIIKAILDAGGFKSTSGITVSGIKAATLSVKPAKSEEVPNYEIRNYSFLTQKENTETAAGSGEAEGEAKVETANTAAYMKDNAPAAISETKVESSDGTYIGLQEALRRIGHGWISEKDTAAMSDADKQLYADQQQISNEEREKLMEVIRNALKSDTVQVGEITADITLNMTYPRYLEFLKYINTLKRATITSEVKQNLIAVPGNYPRDYEIKLTLFVIREMEMPAVFKDTPELNEAVADEAAKADEEIAAADKIAAEEAKKNQEELDAEGKVVTNAANKPPVTAPSSVQTVVGTQPPPLVVSASETTEVTEAPVTVVRT